MLSETSIEQICLIAAQEQTLPRVIDLIRAMAYIRYSIFGRYERQSRLSDSVLLKRMILPLLWWSYLPKMACLGPKVIREHCIDCSVMFDGENGLTF